MSETVFEKQKMKITLLGQSLWLTESNTQDFLDLTEFIIKHGQNKEIDILMYQNAYSLRNALLYNVESLPWWRFIKRFKLKRFISTRTLLKKLSRAQLNKYSELVLEIEGLKAEDEVKKKVADNS